MIKIYNQIDVSLELLKKSSKQIAKFTRKENPEPYSTINLDAKRVMINRLEAIEQYAKGLKPLLETIEYISPTKQEG